MDSPFTTDVLNCPLPPKFRLPQLESYDGSKDPLDHIESFKTMILLQMTPDEVMCKAFPTTLKGQPEYGSTRYPQEPLQTLNNLARVLFVISLGGKGTKSLLAIFSTFNKQKGNH